MNEEMDPQDQIKIEALLHDLSLMRESRCGGCGSAVCGHETLMSLAMGFKDAPQCRDCLAATMATDRDVLRDHIFAYIKQRPCHYEGWLWANREEGFEPDALPGCLWSLTAAPGSEQMPQCPQTDPKRASAADGNSHCDAEWDAGDMGCGDLVLELRMKLRSLKPGQTLKVIARDPGAPADLPAWCRLTENALVASNHPAYWIKRKMT
jgi:tRNA 2-thiouridine synthesizing protein A